MVIEILIGMLMASEPPINPQDINVIELSKVYHHVTKELCLGVESTIKEQEWIEMPQIEDIEIHRDLQDRIDELEDDDEDDGDGDIPVRPYVGSGI